MNMNKDQATYACAALNEERLPALHANATTDRRRQSQLGCEATDTTAEDRNGRPTFWCVLVQFSTWIYPGQM